MTKLEEFIQHLKTSGLHPKFIEYIEPPYPEFPDVFVRLSGITLIDRESIDIYVIGYRVEILYHEKKINRIFSDVVNVCNILDRWMNSGVEQSLRPRFYVETNVTPSGIQHLVTTAERIRID